MTARPLASLSSGLLARPGQAKPAMRPQVFAPTPFEDLGWNDMGQHQPPQPAPEPAPAPLPPVLTERAELAQAVATPARPAARTRKAADVSPRVAHKAAFTLRLDADRHLRLRLASAVAGRSSQQLLVAALDAFLDAQPHVEALARQSQTFSGEK